MAGIEEPKKRVAGLTLSIALRRAARRRPAARPLCPRRQHPLVSGHPLGVLRRQIDQHRRHNRIIPQVLEDDLVERVAVGVPRVDARVPPVAAHGEIVTSPGTHVEAEGGHAGAHEGRVIRPSRLGSPRDLEGHLIRQLAGHAGEPVAEVTRRRGEPLHGDEGDGSGPVVRIENGMGTLEDLRVVLDEGPGAVQSLLLAVPQGADDRAPGVWDDTLQDAHRLHDDDRAGAVVERAGGAVP